MAPTRVAINDMECEIDNGNQHTTQDNHAKVQCCLLHCITYLQLYSWNLTVHISNADDMLYTPCPAVFCT